MSEKIGVLFLQAQEWFGADAAVHADIIRNLDRERFTVHVACTDGGGESSSTSLGFFTGIPDVRLRPTRFAPNFGRLRRGSVAEGARRTAGFSADFVDLCRYVVRERIRIVHSSERPRDSVYNVVLAKLTRAQSIVHVHVKWSEAYGKAAQWSVKRADATFGISRYVSNTLLAFGKPARAVHTILNGIETSRWDPSIDGSNVRRDLGVPSDTLVLASVSRLFSWKGQRELLRAFALVEARIPHVRLLVVGADASEVEGGSFTNELKALAGQLGVAEKVVFTGARMDIPEIMAACDLFTMPSFEEPFGLVFLEAMAMKKPVVAVNNGGTPEVVEHGRSGLLSMPWDVPGLAANILTLLGSRELRARMGEYGRDRVQRRFTAQRMARDAGDAYERIVERRGPARDSELE